MRLRVFRASDMREAMALLRAELGAEAVILDTRRVAGGIELTAAREGGRGEAAPPLGQDEPLLILPSGPGRALPPPLHCTQHLHNSYNSNYTPAQAQAMG